MLRELHRRQDQFAAHIEAHGLKQVELDGRQKTQLQALDKHTTAIDDLAMQGEKSTLALEQLLAQVEAQGEKSIQTQGQILERIDEQGQQQDGS